MGAFGVRGGVVVVAGVGVVEAVDRVSRRGGDPADALPLPAGRRDARGLVEAHGVEVLAGVGIVEAVHVGVGVLVAHLGLLRSLTGSLGGILVRFILVIWRVTGGFVRLVAIVALVRCVTGGLVRLVAIVRRCRRVGIGRLAGIVGVPRRHVVRPGHVLAVIGIGRHGAIGNRRVGSPGVFCRVGGRRRHRKHACEHGCSNDNPYPSERTNFTHVLITSLHQI
ncbi:MAG TPA: hypothetical protein OIM11_07650 [Coriobacteriaceae bacterium]|nr:hypothetical protein [Coriobacteriaceae bacterium]